MDLFYLYLYINIEKVYFTPLTAVLAFPFKPLKFFTYEVLTHTHTGISLIFLSLLFIATSCQKEEPDVSEPSVADIELEQDIQVLLSQLSNDNAINYFDIDFIEEANSDIKLPITGNALTSAAESIYEDFLIKNSVTNFYEDILSSHGYPMWHRITSNMTTGSWGNEIHVIPFTQTSGDSISALMLAIPSPDDEFYSNYDVIRDGYYYIPITREELNQELEQFPKISENIKSYLFFFLDFDQRIFDYSNLVWQDMYEELDGLLGQVPQADEKSCTQHIFVCPPQVLTGEGEQNNFEKNCEVLTMTYECPGLNVGGWIPSGGGFGGIGTETNTPSSAGGYANAQGAVELARIIVSCENESSVDVIVDSPQHGESGGNCEGLLAAVENLGYNALPPTIWLELFESGGHLLKNRSRYFTR